MTYTFAVPIIVQIIAKREPITVPVPIQVIISPAQTPAQELKVEYSFNVKTTPIEVNLSDPIITSAYEYLRSIVNTYVDEDRTLKTLLNYGEDKQSVALSYRRGRVDSNGINTIQLKLLQPVPADISTNTAVFLSREVAKTTIDKFRVRFAPPLDATPYLRPKNLNAVADVNSGRYLHNMTLKKMSLQTGSVGVDDPYKNKTFEDEIFRQWYSYDYKSTELNINFADYSKFVFYSSAAMRLSAFRQKLLTLEKFESERLQFLSSSTYGSNTGSAGFIFVQEKTAQIAKKKEDVIRGFDRYEQYLYFTPSGSISPYTASADYADEGYEYNPIGYWPKDSSGSIYSPYNSIAEEWYQTQSEIAQRFDEFNENNLINTIPSHIRDDDDSGAYITFILMVGHFFDTLKPFIDHYEDIYSRNLNPNEELSKDLVNDIAESFGFKLPTLDSTYALTDEILGTTEIRPRRDLTAEIYKRLLHTMPFFAKAKGTRTALESLLRTIGITPQLLTVRETGTPVSSSYYTFEEFSTGIDFDETKTSYIRLPISASGRNPTTLQFNCSVAKNNTMTLLTGDDKWGLHVVAHPSSSELARIEITSGSNNTVILSSSYQSLFTDELFNITIQNYQQTASLYVIQTEGEDLVFSDGSVSTNTFASLWESTEYVYVGGAGPRVIVNYEGTIDELRLWTDVLSEETILNSAFDPGSNAGDTYTSAVDDLIVQLSFNNLVTSSLSSSFIPNESPYKNISVSPSLEQLFVFNISGSDFIRYNRSIRQDMVIAGSTGYVTSKVKVAPDPIFIDTTNESKRLYRTESIVTPEEKRKQAGKNKVIVAVSPTDIINQNIIRNLGYENINSAIGSPTTLYNTFDKSLDTLKKHYQRYHYVDVNFNRFVRVMSEIGSVIDQVVDYFIPSKATLLKGIIIEPNILEQVKVPPVKNLRFYGKNTRKTLAAVGSLSSSRPDYGATFNASDNIDTKPLTISNYSTYKEQNKLPVSGSFKVNTDKYESKLQFPPVLSGSTSKLSGELDTVLNEISAQLDRYKLVTQYKGTVDFIPQEVTASVSNLKIALETNITAISSSYLPLKGDIHNSPEPSIKVMATYFTSSVEEINPFTIKSSYETYKIQHEEWNSKTFWFFEQNVSESKLPDRPSRIDVGLHNMNKIPYNSSNFGSTGAEPYNRVYSRKLFKSEINTPRTAGESSLYVPGLYDIPPTADFRDFGVYTYFSNTNGIYYFPQTVKTPAYPRPLNQSWNILSQSFDSISTWSHGSQYNIYDVVYQDITTDDLIQLPGITIKDVNAGNRRYYVFKTRPAYTPTADGTTFYSGSVPSYTPPSLDRDNWELLRFTPIQKRVPKRVVFDTFTVTNPELNNFRTTTISIDRIIDIPDRYVDSFTIPAINANSYVQGELSMQNIAVLFALQANNTNLRLRIYRTPEARDLDLSRPMEVRPVGSHGVLLDMPINTSNILQLTNPIPTFVADATPPSGKVYYTMNNLESSVKLGVSLIMYYFAVQIEPRIPKGYLRKHYRFFRDNSTATKRRNYVGCKNTQDTTIDGLPAVQVFLSEGTDLVISPTQTNEEIITGGGGQLNVT